MYSSFQKDLIALINTKYKAKEYFGELADKSRLQRVKTDLPIILVDFVQSDSKNSYDEEVSFNLYLIHATFSKNETLRANTNLALLDFVHSVKRLIVEQAFTDAGPIEIIKTKKMLDAAVEGAYLSVYTMNIKSVLYDREPLNEDITQ